MNERHKEAIQRNYGVLVNQTDLPEMVEALLEKGVFAERMVEQYLGMNDRNSKRTFYLHIMRRGPTAFKHLVDTLWEKGHWDLVRELDPEGEFHDHPRVSQRSNDENYISISGEKKKAKSEAEKERKAPPSPPPPPPPPPQEAAAASDDYTPSFEVKKSTKPIVDEGNDIRAYDISGARRQRVMLLYTYMTFSNDIEAPRRGAERDSANLKYLFHELGFQVVSFFDHKKEETLASLRNLSSTLEGARCVFVVVSSHGYDLYGSSDNYFRCSDGQLFSILDFIEHFSNKALPKLRAVPKVFVFQTCRGMKESYWEGAPPHMRMPALAHDGQSRGAAAARGDARAPRPHDTARIYSNILIAHSTVPGYVSNRNPEEGSWYIQTLCRVFAEHAAQRHVEELLTLVDQQMEETYQRQTSSVDRWGFNGRLYLQPGLHH